MGGCTRTAALDCNGALAEAYLSRAIVSIGLIWIVCISLMGQAFAMLSARRDAGLNEKETGEDDDIRQEVNKPGSENAACVYDRLRQQPAEKAGQQNFAAIFG